MSYADQNLKSISSKANQPHISKLYKITIGNPLSTLRTFAPASESRGVFTLPNGYDRTFYGSS